MSAKKKILIADDEDDILKIYCREFEMCGFEVISTTKGLEVIDLAKIHNPDAILLDLVMPDMDGYKIIKEMKTDLATKHMPIIILSNIGHTEGIEKGILNGADDYIVKGNFTPDEAVEKVKSFLTKK